MNEDVRRPLSWWLGRVALAGGASIVALLVWAIFTQPGSGVITGKGHDAGWTQMVVVGKVVVPIYHGDCWRVDFTADDGRLGSACVDQAEWSEYGVGEQYP